jgi:hypothetical protein
MKEKRLDTLFFDLPYIAESMHISIYTELDVMQNSKNLPYVCREAGCYNSMTRLSNINTSCVRQHPWLFAKGILRRVSYRTNERRYVSAPSQQAVKSK